MLKIPADKFELAVEALMIAARCATDQQGLKIVADIPRNRNPQTPSDIHDYDRIKAITLGAIVALVNGPAHVDAEVHFDYAALRDLRKGGGY